MIGDQGGVYELEEYLCYAIVCERCHSVYLERQLMCGTYRKNSARNWTDKKIDLKIQQGQEEKKRAQRRIEIERRGEQGEREKEGEEAKR